MGGGGTLVEGLRRFFQRRASSSAITTTSHSEQHDSHNNNAILLRDLRSQLASIPILEQQQQQHFDLNPIKVPTSILFAPPSMDPHKKVPLLFFNPSYGDRPF